MGGEVPGRLPFMAPSPGGTGAFPFLPGNRKFTIGRAWPGIGYASQKFSLSAVKTQRHHLWASPLGGRPREPSVFTPYFEATPSIAYSVFAPLISRRKDLSLEGGRWRSAFLLTLFLRRRFGSCSSRTRLAALLHPSLQYFLFW